MRTRWTTPGARATSGQGLVELALALPVLLLILLGTVDLGRMFFDYIEMRNAAREAAGYLSRHPDEAGEAIIRAENHMPGYLADDAGITVSCTGPGCTTAGLNGEATATIKYAFTPVAAGFLEQFGLGSVNLQAEASMRVLS